MDKYDFVPGKISQEQRDKYWTMLLLEILYLFVCVCVLYTNTCVLQFVCRTQNYWREPFLSFYLMVSGIELWSLSLLAGPLSTGTSCQASDPSFLYVKWKNGEVGFKLCLAGARDSGDEVGMSKNCSLECINF